MISLFSSTILFMSKVIPFNKPFFFFLENDYIEQDLYQGKILGNGHFTKK